MVPEAPLGTQGGRADSAAAGLLSPSTQIQGSVLPSELKARARVVLSSARLSDSM